MGGVRRVWITRAEPGASRSAERLRALGFEPVVRPLLAIRYLSPTLDLDGIDAISFTSSNGVAAFAALTPERDWPTLAVGDATAQAARVAGFAPVTSAKGDVEALARLIRDAHPSGATILHVAARVTAGDLASAVGPDIEVRTIVAYEAFETGVAAPDPFDAVLVHSPRAARALASALTPDLAKRCAAVVISEAAAAPLTGLGFVDVRIADQPNDASLTAALGKPGAPV
jgi:uroporphyrinogen-III synthase